MTTNTQAEKELKGFAYGFLGVLIFSLTLPATRIAVSGFDPVFVGLGRAIVAAASALALAYRRYRQNRDDYNSIATFVGGASPLENRIISIDDLRYSIACR